MYNIGDKVHVISGITRGKKGTVLKEPINDKFVFIEWDDNTSSSWMNIENIESTKSITRNDKLNDLGI